MLIRGVAVRLIKENSSDFVSHFDALLVNASATKDELNGLVLSIIDDVKQNGDNALIEQISKFDGWVPSNSDALLIKESEIDEAYDTCESALKEALHLAYDRITTFHEKQLPKSWMHYEDNGSMLGQKVTAVDCAGLYIPGGKASYPSSLIMNAVPAKVAGVKEIIACVPCPNDELNPVVLAAAKVCGITKLYKIGGAGAIAAMAYGTKTIAKADVITGPGNIFVATAKKLLFGEVNIDMIAGPSEIGILADHSADPKTVAIDLLSQAEHDEMARSILVTTDENLAIETIKEVESALQTLPREKIARTSIENNGLVIVANDMQSALDLMNRLAPEHLEVLTVNPHELLAKIRHAGAIFLGAYTPEAIGDYIAGPNHTLPTSGTARFFSPLGVEHFMKKSSVISLSKEGLEEIGAAAALLAKVEGLDAHRLSVETRLNQK
jgi:histidinol dehydrogenase